MVNYEEALSRVDELEKSIELSVEKILHNDSAKDCVICLTGDSYRILEEINGAGQNVSIDAVNYLMGHVLPLLEALIADPDSYEEFKVMLAHRMREYYGAFIKDMRIRVELREAAIQGRH